ncbi:PREDICTED: transmembrane protein 98 [Haliaeetus leucocephalus]|nr:PREDICTED: transmembrane protein 98 [Haliaeetus leucocephalus]
METVVIVAIGVLATIFLASFVALVVVCRQRYCHPKDLRHHYDTKPIVDLMGTAETPSEPSELELDDVVITNPHIEAILENEDWVEDASGLVSHCIAILKICHTLTEKLVAMTMGSGARVKSPASLGDIIVVAKRISPRVDDVVRSMYPCLQEGGGRLPWVQKTPALTRGKDVQCDKERSCPDGNTCCRLSSGTWGCCPLEEAVCCPDHVHCCPQGYTCDPVGGSCLQEGGGRLPWVQKTPALTRGKDVRCDEERSCPDGNTCCRLSSGAWGCCPLEEGIWRSLTPFPLSAAPRAVPCPDGRSECPDDATCCMTTNGTWGCCPMPQASCCADKVHCCPHTTICDLAHGRCLSPTGDGDIPLGTAFPAWKRQPPAPVALHEVLCPDGHSACPDGATCCQLSSAQYGCCPLQNAVCCSDGQHCCPQGTVCDLERSTCTSERSLASLPKGQDWGPSI